jgi:Zn-dependent protease
MSRLLLLLFAGLKFSKLFLSVGSMLLAVGVYALVFGWRYAVGIVAMLLIHELGHFIAARQRGLQAELPMFIPFAFAWVRLRDRPHTAETEAFVALAGPLLGTVGALGAYFLAHNENIPWLLAVAYTGFFINLLNLIPIPPFDGGRITQILSPRIWLLGLPILGVMMWYSFSPILVVIAILAVPYAIAAFRFRADTPEAQAYYALVTPRVRWEYAFYYVVLMVFLVFMMHDTRQQLAGYGGGEDRIEQTQDQGAGSV